MQIDPTGVVSEGERLEAGGKHIVDPSSDFYRLIVFCKKPFRKG